jgi:feruloyl esterase
MMSVRYMNNVRKAVGDAAVEKSMRLFAMPGMGHCSGGIGCDVFDKISELDRWVETGKAPDMIVASKLQGGKVVRTHPLCAYPAVARYKGAGDLNDAANFSCVNK